MFCSPADNFFVFFVREVKPTLQTRGMEEWLLARIVASNCCPGTELTPQLIRQTWSAVCRQAEEALLARKSISVPELCHFVTQEEFSHRGTWNVRRCFIPTVILAPSFTAMSQVRSPVPVAQAHVGTHGTVQLNLVQVADAVNACGERGVGRHVVASILKAIARAVSAEVISSPSPTRSLSFGFALLQFLGGGKSEVRWNTRFLAKFDAAHGVDASNHAAVQRASSATAGSSAQRQGLVLAPHVPQPPSSSARQTSRIPAAPPPMPKSPPGSSRQSELGAPPSAVAPAVPVVAPLDPLSLAPPTPRQMSSRSSSRESGRPALRVPSSPRNAASPRLPDVAQTSPYYRHKLHKLDVRRQRNVAYTDSWSQQQNARAALRLEEMERDKMDASRFTEAVRKGEEADAALSHHRLVVAASIQQENIGAAATHRQHLLPHHESPGDLFVEVPSAPIKPADVEALDAQQRERLQRKAKVMDEDRTLGARLLQDAETYHAEIANEKRRRAARNRSYLEANNVLVAHRRTLKEQLALAEKKHEGGALFLASDDVLLRAKQRREALLEQQKKDLAAHKAQKTVRLHSAKKDCDDEAAALQHLVTKTCLLHDYEAQTRALQQAQNRQAWSSHMRERQQKAEFERTIDEQTKQQVLFRNESSDDEA